MFVILQKIVKNVSDSYLNTKLPVIITMRLCYKDERKSDCF